MKKLFEDFAFILEGFSNYKDMLDTILYHCRGKLMAIDGQTPTEKGLDKMGFRRRTIIKIDDDMDITIYFYPFLRRMQSFADPINRQLHIGILELISYKGKGYRRYGSKKAWSNFQKEMMNPKMQQAIIVFPSIFRDKSFADFVENATIKPMDRPKTFDNILAAVAHEITHISQIKHGGMKWDAKRNETEFDKLPDNIKSKYGDARNYYRTKTHMKSPMEHEARLIEYFQHIKRKSYDAAYKLFGKNYAYLGAFKKRKVLKTMVDFGLSFAEYKRYLQYIHRIMNDGVEEDGYMFYADNARNLFHPKIIEYFRSFTMISILKKLKKSFFDKGYDKKYPKILKSLQNGFDEIG